MLTISFNQLKLRPGQYVLDIGCGEGRHCHGLYFLNPRLNIIGLDANLESLKKAKEGLWDIASFTGSHAESAVQFIHGDAFNLPFPDNSIDVIICSEVLEHLHDYVSALKEMQRVLKPGGQLAISVPHNWTEALCWRLAPGNRKQGGYAFQPGGHIRIFDDYSLRHAIADLGFHFDKKHHAHALHTPYWWLKCMVWSRQDTHFLVRAYHKLLVWEIMKKPIILRVFERLFRGWLGKSVVLYFRAI